jgi:hypothetical protein
LRELWCLTPFLTIFQLYHGYLVLLVEYTEKTTDLLPFNEHSYHVRFQFAKYFQRRRLKSKNLLTMDAK